MLREVVQLSYLSFVADLTLLAFVWFNSTLSKQKKSVFLLAGSIAMIMLICNTVIYELEGKGEHLLILRIFTAISYAVSGPVILPFVFLASVIRKRMRVLLIALATCNTLLSFISIFTGWYFRYDESGIQTLGLMVIIPFGISAVYLNVLLASSYMKYRLGFRMESLFLALLCVFIVIAVVMNSFFDFKYLIAGMAVLGCLFYYLFFSTQTLARDALTNALNRHSFYRDIDVMKRHGMFVISMDLNGLKQLNDTQGHDAGDAAILAVSDTAHAMLPPNCRFYRMGGDEFEILMPNTDAVAVRQLTERLKAAVAAKTYSVAIGYAEYRKGMDFYEVLRKADAMMYDDKARTKQRIAERRGTDA